MSNYIPHYTKKKQQLAHREEAMKRLLNSGASEGKLLLAAREIVDARVRVLRSQRATLPPSERNADDFAIIDGKIEAALQQSVEDILREFRSKLDERKL
jgi:hypothetical protein